MKQYLIDFFKYNKWANLKLLETIKKLPDKDESVKLFSHLITSQKKWMNRITKEVDDAVYNWFGPVMPLDELEGKWTEVIDWWINYIEKNDESGLDKELIFNRSEDNKGFSAKIRDIALQLNYHSIHHRAQINRLIRLQNLEPPKTDYIFTVLKEL